MAASSLVTLTKSGPASRNAIGERPASITRSNCAFIDADKTGYKDYYERAIKLVRPGGLIAVDNTLWNGNVADPENQTEDTQAIRELNRHIHADTRVDVTMLPIGDGLTLALKR